MVGKNALWVAKQHGHSMGLDGLRIGGRLDAELVLPAHLRAHVDLSMLLHVR
jgi:hypothetical protein